MSRTDLNKQQWQALKPHLPENPKRGHTFRDHRQVINGMLLRLKNGVPWCEIPERYGPWQTCWDRFTKWEQDRTWKRILQRLQTQADAVGDIDWDGAALDSFHAKAHRCATGARKQPAEGGKSSGNCSGLGWRQQHDEASFFTVFSTKGGRSAVLCPTPNIQG